MAKLNDVCNGNKQGGFGRQVPGYVDRSIRQIEGSRGRRRGNDSSGPADGMSVWRGLLVCTPYCSGVLDVTRKETSRSKHVI